MIDCFVTHVWRESPQWVEFEKFLYNDKKIKWRNFSLPWHDPALKLGEGLGKKLLLKDLTNQIKPSKIFFLLESLYEKKGNLFWLDFQLKKAVEFKLPIILVPCDIKVDLEPLSNKNIEYYNINYTYDSLHKIIDRLITSDEKEYFKS